MARSTGAPYLEIPEWLSRAIAADGADVDVAGIRRKLAGVGVVSLEPRRDGRRLVGIDYRTPRDGGWVDLYVEGRPIGVGQALTDLAEGLVKFDLLTRLHIASTDMELVGGAARELGRYRHVIGGADSPVHDPHALVTDVAEVGIVVMYARSFTGRAALGNRWKPKDPEQLALHNALVMARSSDHAHADFTPARRLVDTNAMLGGDGPPIYAEQRARFSKEQLLAIAELCEAQGARFYIAAGELKRELGSPAHF